MRIDHKASCPVHTDARRAGDRQRRCRRRQRPGVREARHNRHEIRGPYERQQRKKRIRLGNDATFIHFGGGVKMNAQTSTTSNTRWWMFGLIFIENAYLTE